MDLQVLSAFLAWLQLNSQQREQLHAMVGTVYDASEDDRRRFVGQIDEFFASIDIGPLTTPCPRCGK